MALIANITKDSVTIRDGKPFLSYRLELIDDTITVIDKLITEPFLAVETEEIRAGRYRGQFQELINDYKNQKTIEQVNLVIINNTATKIKNSLVT